MQGAKGRIISLSSWTALECLEYSDIRIFTGASAMSDDKGVEVYRTWKAEEKKREKK